jgi:hypothetical protein
MAISRAPMRPALPSALMWSPDRRADIRHLKVRAARQLGAVLRRLRILRLAHLHREAVAAGPLSPALPREGGGSQDRLDIGFLARLGGEHEGGGERHIDVAKAGLGLFTVRAQSQAMTVSLRPR